MLDVQLLWLVQFGPGLLQHACALTTFGGFGVGFDGDAPTVGHNDEMAGSLPPSSLLDCSTGVAAGRGQSPRSRVAPGKRQTRRRFGGRHPLCGIGVTSRIAVIVKPTACSARSADSRPEPGPFTLTSRVRTPCSCALRPASSAAICAA